MTVIANRSGRLLLLTAATLAAITVASLLARDASTPITRSNQFWRLLSIDALEAEHYDSIDSMTRNAEAVIVGTIKDAALSRSYGGPEDAEVVRMAVIEVEPSAVLAGHLVTAAETVSVEVTLPGGVDIGKLRATLPEERAVFFIRNKGTEALALGWSAALAEREKPFYRLVSSQGKIRNFASVAIPPEDAEDPFLVQVRGRSFDELTREIAAAAR